MKRALKIFLWFVITLLVVIGGIAYYVNEQIGKLDPTGERRSKYSGLAYYSSEADVFISPEKLPYFPEETTGGDPGIARFLRTSPYAPTEPLPKQMLTRDDFSEPPAHFSVRWFGHSSIMIELDGKRILMDPVFNSTLTD